MQCDVQPETEGYQCADNVRSKQETFGYPVERKARGLVQQESYEPAEPTIAAVDWMADA